MPNVRVREVEHGVFTPLVLSATGGMKLQHSTRDWQTEFPGKSERNILSSWGGLAVVFLLQSSAQPFYAFEEADPLAITQSTK